MSGRSRQHAEVAVAVDPRWRHQSTASVEQLQRGEDQRRTGAGIRFGVVVFYDASGNPTWYVATMSFDVVDSVRRPD